MNLYSRSNVELNWVKEKDEIIFECEIDSNPMIIEVGWLFNGAKLLSDVKNGEFHQSLLCYVHLTRKMQNMHN